MKIGDYVTVVYYIPEDNKYGPLLYFKGNGECYPHTLYDELQKRIRFEYALMKETLSGFGSGCGIFLTVYKSFT